MPDEMLEYLHSLKSIDYNRETTITEDLLQILNI